MPDLVPLWAAVPKKTPPAGENLLKLVVENTNPDAATPPPLPQQPKPVPSNVRRRLLLKDKGALDFMKKWFENVKKDWTEAAHAMGFLPGSDFEKTAWLMMMGFATQDSRHIERVTGWDRQWIQERRERARKYGIWTGNGSLHAHWFDLADRKDGSAEIAWMLDVMVMNGDMERVWMYKNGKKEAGYKLSPKGVSWASKLPKEPGTPSRRELDRYTDDGNPNG